MPETSVKDQVKKLIELQKLDGEMYDLNQQLHDKPAEVAELKEQFEIKKAKLNELEEQLKGIQVSRKEQELNLKSKEDEISKGDAQLLQLKTNKEYTAKISEIENIKADKSLIEDKILKSFDEGDAVNAEIEQERGKVAQEEKHYLAKKKEAEDDIKVIEDRLKVLESQKKQAAPAIDPAILARYDLILTHKEGKAIVPVSGSSCGGCFMNVTTQQVNEIKMNEEMVFCELCTRILYVEDDL